MAEVPPAVADPSADPLEHLLRLTAQLRRACPWDREQTPETIVPHTVEEAYEVADAVRSFGRGESDDLHNVEAELGDLLFQVVFLTTLCNERNGSITFDSVARGIYEKLVRRHPHIFGDASAQTADDVRGTWEQVKREQEGRGGLFDDVASTLTPLAHARKVQQRAAGVGFDFPSAFEALSKVEEELAELREAIEQAAASGVLPQGESTAPVAAVEQEIGDLVFAVTNVARLTRSDADLALRDTSRRFVARVRTAQQIASEREQDFAALQLSEQEELYQQAKVRLGHGAA